VEYVVRQIKPAPDSRLVGHYLKHPVLLVM